MTHSKNRTVIGLLFSAILGVLGMAKSSADEVIVSSPVPQNGSPDDPSQPLETTSPHVSETNLRPESFTVKCDEVLIRVDAPKMWTLSGINHQQSVIAVQESAYGCVLNIKGAGALGSAHFLDIPGQPGKVEKEQISLLEFFLNGRQIKEFGSQSKLIGQAFRMRRDSRIRAIEVKSTLDLRDNLLTETVQLTTKVAVDLRVGYPLMYAWSPEMTDYIFGDDRGIRKRGRFLTAKGQPTEGVEPSANWMAVYNSKTKKGAVFCLTQRPGMEPGVLQYTDAPGTYRKLRVMCFTEKTIPAGFDGTFQSTVGFFNSDSTGWENVAVQMISELRPTTKR